MCLRHQERFFKHWLNSVFQRCVEPSLDVDSYEGLWAFRNEQQKYRRNAHELAKDPTFSKIVFHVIQVVCLKLFHV